MARPLAAAVDIGTVSTRLACARLEDGGLRAVWRESRITDLGEGVDAAGALAPAAVERTCGAVRDYLARVRALAGPEGALVSCTTTSAARDASNAEDLLRPLRAMGLAPQVLPGQAEAGLSLLGVTADFGGEPVAVADVGGGSTELSGGRRAGDGSLVRGAAASFDVGCRRVTERFLPGAGPVPREAELAARAFVREALAPFFATDAGLAARAARLVCVGGTATSLVSVEAGLVPYDSAFVHLRRMPRAAVSGLAARLCGLSVEQRAQLPGLQAKRAPVIAAGALIVDELMGLGGWGEYTASESDSLAGLLACVRARLEGAPSPLPGWEAEPARL